MKDKEIFKYLLALWLLTASFYSLASDDWNTYQSTDVMDDSNTVGAFSIAKNESWPYKAKIFALCSGGNYQLYIDDIGYVGGTKLGKFRADNDTALKIFFDEGTNDSLFLNSEDVPYLISRIQKSNSFIIRVRSAGSTITDWHFSGMGFNKSFASAVSSCGDIKGIINEQGYTTPQDRVDKEIEKLNLKIKNTTPLPLFNEVETRTDPRGAFVDDEVSRYSAIYTQMIQQNLPLDQSFVGKECILTLHLLANGLVLSASEERGDNNLCRAAKSALVKVSMFPMPDSRQVVKRLQNIRLKIHL